MRRGFTLIELLMVIAIIALLISILLPSLRSSRESGWQVKCQSNQRQLGMASEFYSEQFDEWVVRECGTGRDRERSTAGYDQPWPWSWRLLREGRASGRAGRRDGRDGWSHDHFESAEYYQDPAYPSWDWHQVHYANNGMDFINSDTDAMRWFYHKPLTKRFAIKFPSSLFAMIAYQDDDDNNRYNDLYGRNRPNKEIAIWYDVRMPAELVEGRRETRASPTRHGLGSNILRYDGHVAWERQETILDPNNWDDRDDSFSRLRYYPRED